MKRLAIFAAIVIMVFAIGCQPQDEGPVSETVFKGGSQGLLASFEPFGFEEDGGYAIYDTDTFPVEVYLQNKGEEDIEAGDAKVILKGISIADFDRISSSELTNKEKIEKVSDFNKLGGEASIDFTPGDDAKFKLDVIGFTNIDIFAAIEYLYKTRVIVPKVCFKEDLRDPSICNVEESKEYSVSSAPITVTGVREEPAGKGIMALVFTINNVGGGKVTIPGQEFDVRYGKVKYEIDEPEKWECKAAGLENEARLQAGVAEIRCRLKEPLESDALYTRQVALTLEYKYQSIIQNSLKIKESQN
ncbi:hypothetical protein KY337_01325 [Candidatus Woesearchaeota archaeon]|nr:hypothetical protein [Candidatus Woesearchaeota archaeon]